MRLGEAENPTCKAEEHQRCCAAFDTDAGRPIRQHLPIGADQSNISSSRLVQDSSTSADGTNLVQEKARLAGPADSHEEAEAGKEEEERTATDDSDSTVFGY